MTKPRKIRTRRAADGIEKVILDGQVVGLLEETTFFNWKAVPLEGLAKIFPGRASAIAYLVN